MFEVPGARADASAAVSHEQVPAPRILGGLVQPVGCELVVANVSAFQVDAATETLHLAHEHPMAIVVVRDVLEVIGNDRMRGRQEHQALFDRSDIPLE
jgi:hypothetical protein